MSRSLPYVLLLAAIGLAVTAYLYIMLDQVAAEIFTSGTWAVGNEYSIEGQGYVREMWERALLLVLTGGAATIIIISRRTGGGVWR
jgi:hypothetical protein